MLCVTITSVKLAFSASSNSSMRAVAIGSMAKVGFLSPGGEHDQRNALGLLAPLQLPADLEPIDAGKHQIGTCRRARASPSSPLPAGMTVKPALSRL